MVIEGLSCAVVESIPIVLSLPRRAVVAAARWVLLAGVHYQCMDVFIFTPTELASECSRDVAVIRFMVATVRIVHTRVQQKRPQACVFLPAVDAEEWSAGVALEKRMLALVRAVRMVVAGVPKKRRRIPIFLSAIFAELAHIIGPCRR